jgi:protein arginine kinase activator
MSANPVCTQCGFTLAEFRARGLLGCPACYSQLGEALRAELLQLHPALHRTPAFAATATGSTGKTGEDSAALRERLSDALRGERYEEAAALRRRLDDMGKPDRAGNQKPDETP